MWCAFCCIRKQLCLSQLDNTPNARCRRRRCRIYCLSVMSAALQCVSGLACQKVTVTPSVVRTSWLGHHGLLKRTPKWHSLKLRVLAMRFAQDACSPKDTKSRRVASVQHNHADARVPLGVRRRFSAIGQSSVAVPGCRTAFCCGTERMRPCCGSDRGGADGGKGVKWQTDDAV